MLAGLVAVIAYVATREPLSMLAGGAFGFAMPFMFLRVKRPGGCARLKRRSRRRSISLLARSRPVTRS